MKKFFKALKIIVAIIITLGLIGYAIDVLQTNKKVENLGFKIIHEKISGSRATYDVFIPKEKVSQKNVLAVSKYLIREHKNLEYMAVSFYDVENIPNQLQKENVRFVIDHSIASFDTSDYKIRSYKNYRSIIKDGEKVR